MEFYFTDVSKNSYRKLWHCYELRGKFASFEDNGNELVVQVRKQLELLDKGFINTITATAYNSFKWLLVTRERQVLPRGRRQATPRGYKQQIYMAYKPNSKILFISTKSPFRLLMEGKSKISNLDPTALVNALKLQGQPVPISNRY